MTAPVQPAQAAPVEAILKPHRSFLRLLANNTEASSQEIASVDDAIKKALAAKVPWMQILFTLLPFILSIFTGGTVDIAALIAAILALLKPPTP